MIDQELLNECNWQDPNDIRRWLLAFPPERFPGFRPDEISRVEASHPLGPELAWAAVKGGIRTTEYEHVRRRLRLALDLAGISPSKAAQAIAVHKGVVSKFINGKRASVLSQNKLVGMADLADIPSPWLLDGMCSVNQFSAQHKVGRSLIIEGYSLGDWRGLKPLFGYRAAVMVLEKLSNILVGLVNRGEIHRGPSGLPEIQGKNTQSPEFWCWLLLKIHDGEVAAKDEKERIGAKWTAGIWMEEMPGIPLVIPAFIQHLTDSMEAKIDDEKVSFVATRRQLRWLLNKVKKLASTNGSDFVDNDEKMCRDLIPRLSEGIAQPAHRPTSALPGAHATPEQRSPDGM